MGSNAANILVVAPTASFAQIMDLVENDWSRHIVDLGPIIGIGYIVFRIVFTIHLGIIAVQSAIRYSDPRPWLIFSAIGIEILNGTVAGQTTLNGLTWFYVGLVMAAPTYRRSFR
jgi:hypothetical protein